MGRSSCNGAPDMQQICTAHAQQGIARAVNAARHEGITNFAEVCIRTTLTAECARFRCNEWQQLHFDHRDEY